VTEASRNTPLLSVIMITYKHEGFIAEAIDGVLMQECDFEVELIIADDCSPDKTSLIVSKYIETHPKGQWIKYTRHEHNKGMMPNFIWALEQAKGKYIALCEGDDYWIDALKLQRQVDFLKANPSFSFCFSNISHVDQFDKELSESWPNRIEAFTITKRMLGEEYLIPTPTILFKNNILNKEIMGKMSNSPLGDYLISSLLLLEGNGYYFPDKMASYRHHENGVFSKIDIQHKVNAGLKTRRILFRFFIRRARIFSALVLLKNSRTFKRRYQF
jgi:glycosyltransferase involved in cell wall biosynthesis